MEYHFISMVIASPRDAGRTHVPFWLQILLIALAPILGFGGVAIGALLNERNRERAYITDARREVYQSFLEVLSEMAMLYGSEYLALIRDSQQDKLKSAYEKLQPMMEQLQRAYLHIRLVGSPDVERTAVKAFPYVEQVGILQYVPLQVRLLIATTGIQ